jgi:hypothetical protein
MRHISRVKIVGHLAEVLMLLAVISPTCSGQASNRRKPQNKDQTSFFTGCYELVLGKWLSWSFGEDTVFVTPPTRIELLAEPGTKGFETNSFIIRAIPRQTNVSPGRPVSSFWQMKSSTHVDLVWTDGLSPSACPARHCEGHRLRALLMSASDKRNLRSKVLLH